MATQKNEQSYVQLVGRRRTEETKKRMETEEGGAETNTRTKIEKIRRRSRRRVAECGGERETALTLLEPQSAFGDKLLKFQAVCPQNGTAVLKG